LYIQNDQRVECYAQDVKTLSVVSLEVDLDCEFGSLMFPGSDELDNSPGLMMIPLELVSGDF